MFLTGILRNNINNLIETRAKKLSSMAIRFACTEVFVEIIDTIISIDFITRYKRYKIKLIIKLIILNTIELYLISDNYVCCI